MLLRPICPPLHGAVYTIRVGRFPQCSCPDATKGNVCKHYLYVMIRVLRLKRDDPIVWQRALLTSEAEEVCLSERLAHLLLRLHAGC